MSIALKWTLNRLSAMAIFKSFGHLQTFTVLLWGFYKCSCNSTSPSKKFRKGQFSDKFMIIKLNWVRIFRTFQNSEFSEFSGKLNSSRTRIKNMRLNELTMMIIIFMTSCLKHYWFSNVFLLRILGNLYLLSYQQFGNMHLCQ